MSEYVPGYKNLLDTGELEIRVRILNEKLNKCTLCPHQCRAYRNQGEKVYAMQAAAPLLVVMVHITVRKMFWLEDMVREPYSSAGAT